MDQALSLRSAARTADPNPDGESAFLRPGLSAQHTRSPFADRVAEPTHQPADAKRLQPGLFVTHQVAGQRRTRAREIGRLHQKIREPDRHADRIRIGGSLPGGETLPERVVKAQIEQARRRREQLPDLLETFPAQGQSEARQLRPRQVGTPGLVGGGELKLRRDPGWFGAEALADPRIRANPGQEPLLVS